MNLNKAFSAGFLQEEMVRLSISSLPNIRIISNKRLYSFKLKKQTEIDMIVITPNRLYCLEVKSYNNIMKGDFNDRIWIAGTGKIRDRLYNPVFQNAEHIRTLRNNLRRKNYPVLEFLNLVVVPNTCEIISDCPSVIKIGELVYLLEKDTKVNNLGLDIDKIYDILLNLEVI